MESHSGIQFQTDSNGQKSHVVLPLNLFMEVFTQELKEKDDKFFLEVNQDLFEAIEFIIEDRGMGVAIQESLHDEEFSFEHTMEIIDKLA